MKKSLIVLISLISMGALAAPLSAEMIAKNKTLAWSTSAGQNGSMTISAVNGQYFEADQTNANNRGAGVLKLYGAVIDGGKKIVMINTSQWKEVWEGAVSATEISGSLSSGSAKYTFKITEPVSVQSAPIASVSTDPFVIGAVLKWSTSIGQNGTMKVTSVSGTQFTIDQVNVKNAAAGVTKLEGEFKDGKVFIYNKKWNETWMGTVSGGTVKGKIKGSIDFSISK